MPRFLALDADAGGLFVAAGDLGKAGLRVEHTLAAADDLGSLTPSNAAARGARLKELLAAAAVKPAPLLVLVGRDRVVPKDVTHPPTAPADEPAVVRFQAARDLTDAPDDVVMDYQPLPAGADGQRRAAAVFVRKDVLAAARTLADAAGLKLAAVTPRPFTAPTVARRAGAALPAAVVSAWPGGGELTVVTDGRVKFSSPLTAADPAGEVKRKLAGYAGQHPDHPLASVLVAVGPLADRLADSLAVPVQAFDPAAGVPGAELIAPSLRGRLAGPLGLLDLRSAGEALPINFVQPRLPRNEPNKNRGRLLLAGLAALLLVGMAGAVAYLQLDAADTRLADLRQQKKDMEGRVAAVQKDVIRLKAADDFAAREAVLLDELYELARRVPDVGKLAVVEFDMASKPVPVTKKGAAPPKGPQAVATMRIKFRSGDDKPVRQVVDSLNQDKQYYVVVRNDMTPTSEQGNKGVQRELTIDVFHRSPDKYTKTITAPPPAAAAPAPAAADFGEGFAP